jgi:hypothetical protein
MKTASLSDTERVKAVLESGGTYATYELAKMANCAHNSAQRALWQLRHEHGLNIASRKLHNSQVKEYWLIKDSVQKQARKSCPKCRADEFYHDEIYFGNHAGREIRSKITGFKCSICGKEWIK